MLTSSFISTLFTIVLDTFFFGCLLRKRREVKKTTLTLVLALYNLYNWWYFCRSQFAFHVVPIWLDRFQICPHSGSVFDAVCVSVDLHLICPTKNPNTLTMDMIQERLVVSLLVDF